jgi:hypothetical protein
VQTRRDDEDDLTEPTVELEVFYCFQSRPSEADKAIEYAVPDPLTFGIPDFNTNWVVGKLPPEWKLEDRGIRIR